MDINGNYEERQPQWQPQRQPERQPDGPPQVGQSVFRILAGIVWKLVISAVRILAGGFLSSFMFAHIILYGEVPRWKVVDNGTHYWPYRFWVLAVNMDPQIYFLLITLLIIVPAVVKFVKGLKIWDSVAFAEFWQALDETWVGRFFKRSLISFACIFLVAVVICFKTSPARFISLLSIFLCDLVVREAGAAITTPPTQDEGIFVLEELPEEEENNINRGPGRGPG